MDRIGAGLDAGIHNGIGQKIGLSGRRRTDTHGLVGHLHMQRAFVGIGVNRHRPDPHCTCGLDDAAGNFTAIGNKDGIEHWKAP